MYGIYNNMVTNGYIIVHNMFQYIKTMIKYFMIYKYQTIYTDSYINQIQLIPWQTI